MEQSLERDRFDIGANWYKYAAITKIEDSFPMPACRKENGCIHELSLTDHLCLVCTKWLNSQEIINIMRSIS